MAAFLGFEQTFVRKMRTYNVDEIDGRKETNRPFTQIPLSFFMVYNLVSWIATTVLVKYSGLRENFKAVLKLCFMKPALPNLQ